MRTVTSLLAFFGIYWALSGVVFFLTTLGSFKDAGTAGDFLKILYDLVLLGSGYWVWWGWIRYSFTERFPRMGQRAFWYVSLVHHILGVLYLVPHDVWGGGDDPWWVPGWVILNIVIAMVFIIRRPVATGAIIQYESQFEDQ